MPIDAAVRGSLFPEDFLTASVDELPEWEAFDAAALDDFTAAARDVLARFPTRGTPNESETEDDLIWPILSHLGWTTSLRQQKLSRADVPDGLLFTDAAAKTRAVGLAEGPARYAIGAALVESKRWHRPLDRASGRSGEALAPSTQMLRYLRRADDLTDGGLRWGMLTNGAQWRLYYQGARSVAEQFFEIDLPAALGLPGPDDAPLLLSEADRRRACRLFVLFFGRTAFLPDPADGRTLHQRAIQGARYFEERVAANLSKLVFEQVFPDLARAIAAAAPDAALPAVRDAALVLLYQLLFILYAEDRGLLPVHDARYAKVGLRRGVREDVGRRKDRGEAFSDTAAWYWNTLADLCRVIDRGDPAFGLPPYNGGLFDEARTPLLARVRLSNRVMADVIDALSFERPSGPAAQAERRYINYRSLSVQQLGSIYERLLEYETVREDGGIVVRPNVFARKGSGSYYTPDALVGLILDETVGPLAQRKLDAFRTAVTTYDSNRDLRALAAADPAEALLDLKICDPAMGSGHFLVSLVDLLSDRVIAAIAEADAAVEGYVSPLTRRIADIRRTILDNAAANGWTVDAAQLDDRHVIRRMVLKRCIYGVDKNPMAVELAKVSLWLHTFTVGAPLSFLDHHLRRGDSLFGCWARQGIERTGARPDRGRALPQLAGRVSRRLDRPEKPRAHRRVRRGDRQPAVGPRQAATGRMVRRMPPGRGVDAARRGPQTHDRRPGTSRRPPRRGLPARQSAGRGHGAHGADLRRLSLAVARRREPVFAVRGAGHVTGEAGRRRGVIDTNRHCDRQDIRAFFRWLNAFGINQDLLFIRKSMRLAIP